MQLEGTVSRHSNRWARQQRAAFHSKHRMYANPSVTRAGLHKLSNTRKRRGRRIRVSQDTVRASRRGAIAFAQCVMDRLDGLQAQKQLWKTMQCLESFSNITWRFSYRFSCSVFSCVTGFTCKPGKQNQGGLASVLHFFDGTQVCLKPICQEQSVVADTLEPSLQEFGSENCVVPLHKCS